MASEHEEGERRTVQQVGVWSLAKMMGLMGILWSIILAVPVVVLGGPFGGQASVGTVVVLVAAAGLYGGFGGAVTAVIYNLAAEFAGGIELQLSYE